MRFSSFFLNFSAIPLINGILPLILPFEFLKFINPVNYIFIRSNRLKSFIFDSLGINYSLNRLKAFITLVGYDNVVFLSLIAVKRNSKKYGFFEFRLTEWLSSFFYKPYYFVTPYRPGLLTNWRSNLQYLMGGIYTRSFKPKSNRNTVFRKRVYGFPAFLLSFYAFQNLYVFAEAELLELPVLGPASLYLNFYYFTYSYPVLSYSDKNMSFFKYFFFSNYVKGRLLYFFLNTEKEVIF